MNSFAKVFFMCDCKNIISCIFSNPFQLSTLLENMLVLHAPAVMIIFRHNVAFFFFFLLNSLAKFKKRFVQRCARIVLDFNFSSVEKVSAQRLYLENLLSLKSAAPTSGPNSRDFIRARYWELCCRRLIWKVSPVLSSDLKLFHYLWWEWHDMSTNAKVVI